MTQAITSRRLTFIYFGLLALSIVGVHFTLDELSYDKLEATHAHNLTQYARQVAEAELAKGYRAEFAIPPFSHAYVGYNALPKALGLDADMPLDRLIEFQMNVDEEQSRFAWRTEVEVEGQLRDLFLISFDPLYETSENQAMEARSKQTLLSLGLIATILVVFMHIAERLTRPLRLLSDKLKQRSPDDFSPIDLPSGMPTQEILQLVGSLNQFQEKNRTLIDRERSFNRFASHELRSPLMVIKGAVFLLGQSSAPDFLEKQRQRLKQASEEMDGFISTLLSLTREEKLDPVLSRLLPESEVQQIVAEHATNLARPGVGWQVHVADALEIKIPEATLKILIGNLVKNAFESTEEGSVAVAVTSDSISVTDAGLGLGCKSQGTESYGLGLVIVRDICRKYGWLFSLTDNPSRGCTALIQFTGQGDA